MTPSTVPSVTVIIDHPSTFFDDEANCRVHDSLQPKNVILKAKDYPHAIITNSQQ